MNSESITELFERDVLFSLMKFKLVSRVAGPHVLHNLQSMLSNHCLYLFDVSYSVTALLSIPEISQILFNTFKQFKGQGQIDLGLSSGKDMYFIRAFTIPRRDKYFYVDFYLDRNIAYEYK